jgi:hypothetical protein
MKAHKTKKTLIEPKIRLLIRIYLHGVKDESNYLAKLAEEIGYEKGSLKSHLLTTLLDKNLIESTNPDRVSPPYQVTQEAKEILMPFLVIKWLGYASAIFEAVLLFSLFAFYIDNRPLLIFAWLPIAIVGFVILTICLILYPRFLLKLGKIKL